MKLTHLKNSSKMAEINDQMKPPLHSLDPISLILSHNTSNTDQPIPLKLNTQSIFMERGPRYREYTELRETKLRMKLLRQQEREETVENEFKEAPLKKQVKFRDLTSSKTGRSVLYQSVPDFSGILKKENRKPKQQLTPPPAKNVSKFNGVSSNSRGSKSVSAGEKKIGVNGGLSMARKSYACIEDLKVSSTAAANAINVENKRGNGGGGGGNRRTGRVLWGNRIY